MLNTTDDDQSVSVTKFVVPGFAATALQPRILRPELISPDVPSGLNDKGKTGMETDIEVTVHLQQLRLVSNDHDLTPTETHSRIPDAGNIHEMAGADLLHPLTQ